jgi:hypothetical protein
MTLNCSGASSRPKKDRSFSSSAVTCTGTAEHSTDWNRRCAAFAHSRSRRTSCPAGSSRATGVSQISSRHISTIGTSPGESQRSTTSQRSRGSRIDRTGSSPADRPTWQVTNGQTNKDVPCVTAHALDINRSIRHGSRLASRLRQPCADLGVLMGGASRSPACSKNTARGPPDLPSRAKPGGCVPVSDVQNDGQMTVSRS